jgi:hypothetical protein
MKNTKRKKADTFAIRVVSRISFEAVDLNLSLENRSAASSPLATSKSERSQMQNIGEPKKSMLGQAIGWPSTLYSNVSPVASLSMTILPTVDEPISFCALSSAFATYHMSTEVKRLSIKCSIQDTLGISGAGRLSLNKRCSATEQAHSHSRWITKPIRHRVFRTSPRTTTHLRHYSPIRLCQQA